MTRTVNNEPAPPLVCYGDVYREFEEAVRDLLKQDSVQARATAHRMQTVMARMRADGPPCPPYVACMATCPIGPHAIPRCAESLIREAREMRREAEGRRSA